MKSPHREFSSCLVSWWGLFLYAEVLERHVKEQLWLKSRKLFSAVWLVGGRCWVVVGGTTLIIIKLFGEFDSVFKTAPANSIFPGSKYRWGEVLNNFLNILKKLWGIQLPNFMLWWKNICSWHGLWSFKIENHKFLASTLFYTIYGILGTSFSCSDYLRNTNQMNLLKADSWIHSFHHTSVELKICNSEHKNLNWKFASNANFVRVFNLKTGFIKFMLFNAEF